MDLDNKLHNLGPAIDGPGIKVDQDECENTLFSKHNDNLYQNQLNIIDKRRNNSLGGSSSHRTESESSVESVIEPMSTDDVQRTEVLIDEFPKTIDLSTPSTSASFDEKQESNNTIQLLQQLIHRRTQLKEMDRHLFSLISQCLARLDSEETRAKIINWLPLDTYYTDHLPSFKSMEPALTGSPQYDKTIGFGKYGDSYANHEPILSRSGDQYIDTSQLEEQLTPASRPAVIDLSLSLSQPRTQQQTGLTYNQLVGDEKISTPSTTSASNPLNTWLHQLNPPSVSSPVIHKPSSAEPLERRQSTNSSIFNFRKSRLLDGISLNMGTFDRATSEPAATDDRLCNNMENYELKGQQQVSDINSGSCHNEKHGRKTEVEQTQHPETSHMPDMKKLRLDVDRAMNHQLGLLANDNGTNYINHFEKFQDPHHLHQQQQILPSHQTIYPSDTQFLTSFDPSILAQNYQNLFVNQQISPSEYSSTPITTSTMTSRNSLTSDFMIQSETNNHQFPIHATLPRLIPGSSDFTNATNYTNSMGSTRKHQHKIDFNNIKQSNIDYELLARLGCDHQKLLAHQCHVCGSGFEDRHRLQQHLSIHLNLHPSWFEERTIKETMDQYESKRGDYLCTTCSIRFETTAEFDKHMQMHGEKPHRCDLCFRDSKSVSFRFYRQLLTHLRSHCFLYCCRFVPNCKQKANRKDYLKLHILKHHLNNKLPECYTICCH